MEMIFHFKETFNKSRYFDLESGIVFYLILKYTIFLLNFEEICEKKALIVQLQIIFFALNPKKSTQ